jgi:hypothetical protein
VRLSKEHDELIEQFKNDRAAWRERIKAVVNARAKAQDAFMVGAEMRELTCVEVYDAERKVMQYLHAGKVVREREATLEEQAREGTEPMFDKDGTRAVMAQERNKRTKKDLTA